MTVSLIERLDAQVEMLQAERKRILDQAATNVGTVEIQLATLAAARKAITPEVEQAYGALLALKMIKEI